MQLVLPVYFRKQDSLDTFVLGENAQIIAHLQNLLDTKSAKEFASQRICVISGAQGSGKSHLLLAICEQASLKGLSHQYIDLAQVVNMPTELLLGFVNKDVVCIDNLQMLDGLSDWQRAVFDTINQFTEQNKQLLLIATSQATSELEYKLPDLKTRLTWGTNFTLKTLGDDDKQSALVKHLDALGISYSDDVITFLTRRTSRDMHSFINTLKALDKASLEEKRKITIPFIKSVLDL